MERAIGSGIIKPDLVAIPSSVLQRLGAQIRLCGRWDPLGFQLAPPGQLLISLTH